MSENPWAIAGVQIEVDRQEACPTFVWKPTRALPFACGPPCIGGREAADSRMSDKLQFVVLDHPTRQTMFVGRGND